MLPSGGGSGGRQHLNYQHHQSQFQQDYDYHYNRNNKDSLDVVGANKDNMIAIQIIQPTPNISPSCSLRSFSGEGSSPEAITGYDPSATTPFINPLTASPTSSLKKGSSSLAKPVADRRVSFSEDSATAADEVGANNNRLSASSNQSSASPPSSSQLATVNPNIPCMNYLQVPGQQPNISFVVPAVLTPEAKVAHASPAAKKRRETRLLKLGSFCSINSDGDGDIFGPQAELLTPTKLNNGKSKKAAKAAAAKKSSYDDGTGENDPEREVLLPDTEEQQFYPPEGRSVSEMRTLVQPSPCASPSPVPPTGDRASRRHSSKSSFDPLSEYSEFMDDCRSDISDLFSQPQQPDLVEVGNVGVIGANAVVGGAPMDIIAAANKLVLQAQGTLSDQGSIKSLSIDQEDVFRGPGNSGADNNEDDDPTTTTTERLPAPLRPYNNPEYDQIMQRAALLASSEDHDGDEEVGLDGVEEGLEEAIYASSSCSISMGSEGELSHQITVPVTIEPPPRFSVEDGLGIDEDSSSRLLPPQPESENEPVAACAGGESASSSFGQQSTKVAAALGHVGRATLAHQETLHTDSGLDTEDIVPASPPNTFMNFSELSADPTPKSKKLANIPPDLDDQLLIDPSGLKMVLVRDIGVQVCGDSPNLNMSSSRRSFEPSPQRESTFHEQQQRSASQEVLGSNVTNQSLVQQSSLQLQYQPGHEPQTLPQQPRHISRHHQHQQQQAAAAAEKSASLSALAASQGLTGTGQPAHNPRARGAVSTHNVTAFSSSSVSPGTVRRGGRRTKSRDGEDNSSSRENSFSAEILF